MRYLFQVALCLAVLTTATVVSALSASPQAKQGPLPQPQKAPPIAQPEPKPASQTVESRSARGKKLVLKDGNFQLVRGYERKGDRVRYFSAERSDWEELPAALVDWEATAKAEKAAEAEADALAQKAHAQEEARKIETAADVDASVQVAPDVFLPPGEGLYAIDGKAVTPLEQVGSSVKIDKKRLLTQVVAQVPIIPSKHHVEIPGPKAKIRIRSDQPEFYLREAPPDPDRATPVRPSSRPGEAGPEIELVRAVVKGGKRQLETIRSLLGRELSTERNVISVQRWDIAPTLFRFTISQTLPPGEYALAEILPDGMNLYVWDFGVDGAAPTAVPKK